MRGVLLDRDGVLLLMDEEALYRKALDLGAYGMGKERALAFLARAVRWINEEVRALSVRTVVEEEALFRALAEEAVRELRAPLAKVQGLRYYHFMRPAPGALDLLKALKAQGLKVGVLSNTLPSLRESLAHHGLAEYVDGFYASCTLGVAKPDPRAFLLALQDLGIPPREVFYLDDDPENVRVARALGLRAEIHVPGQPLLDAGQ
ncbi:HAD family phosphatase [Thermus sp.]|uniref:HAD family hydrolase n=1 Tax=Thermus sp. TaxID=275 RepID=UPI00307F7131